MPTYDYFISYNKNDLRHARRIATLVKNAGLKCWWQNEDSRQEYANEIKAAINSSTAFWFFCPLFLPNPNGLERNSLTP